MKQQISLVVTDLDNTLYDWVAMWYKSFNAMLDQLIAKSEIPRVILEAEIQAVFQKYGTSEYAFVIEEIPSLRSKHPNEDLALIYTDAITAYRIARQSSLRLYPGVHKTLKQLKQKGCLIVAFTESMEFYTLTRLKMLHLDGLLDYVYSPPDHEKPTILNRYYAEEYYTLQHTVQRFIPLGERKPNPDILLSIINADGIQSDREGTIYVGDSLMKDVKMAQDAGVIDVHAQYGIATHTAAYEMLRKVTHWTQEDVEREKKILAGGIIKPTYVMGHSFAELLDIFDFIPHKMV